MHLTPMAQVIYNVLLKMKFALSVLFILLMSFPCRSDEVTHREGVSFVIEDFMGAWNDEDIPRFVGLFHPESQIRKSWIDESKREKISKEFVKMTKSLGKMKGHKIGHYLERKDRIVLKIEYSKGGSIPGTISLANKRLEHRWTGRAGT